MVLGGPAPKLESMLRHAPLALRIRTTRSVWPWPMPRLSQGAAVYAAVCVASVAAAALFAFVLLRDDGALPQGPIAAGATDSRPRTSP